MQTARGLTNNLPLKPRTLYNDSSDHALIGHLAGGDRRAMRVLYARHNVRVYRFVLRLTGNTATAEDLVSEVFLDVWLDAKKFEGRSQPSTWLLAIARNKAIETMRRRSTEQLDDDAAALIEDPADDPESAKERKDRASLLQRCLIQLSPAHREVIDLAYYHEKSVEEVAEIVGISSATVKTRMHYARKRIAELLAESGDGSSFRFSS